MNLLALDTGTEHLSVALGCGLGTPQAQVWRHDGPGGAQASATLVPAVLDLLQQAGLALAALDAIAFGRGPGSFTGLRTACAVAQGLAFGADLPLLPVDSLLAVAEDARHRHGATRVVAALDARMDQIYTAAYDLSAGPPTAAVLSRLVAPEALQVEPPWVLAGNVAAAYGERLPGAACLPALPTAEALLRLAPVLLAAGHAVRADDALPLYVRDKVAQTTAERLAAKGLA